MKIKKIILIVIAFMILLCTAACSNDDNENDSDGFNFSLNFGSAGGINCIDTYNGTFTKDLIRNGTETIDFIIPDDKMTEFYEAFLEYEIFDMPDNLSVESGISPENTFIFTYTYNKETRTILCDGANYIMERGKEETPQKKFVAFANMICWYIWETEEYNNMSPVSGGYY